MCLIYCSIKLLTENTPLWCCPDFTFKRSDTDPNLFWTFCSNKRGRLVRRPWKGRHISNQYIFMYLSHSLISFLKTCRFWQVHRYRFVQRYPFLNILSLVKMILYYDIISKCQVPSSNCEQCTPPYLCSQSGIIFFFFKKQCHGYWCAAWEIPGVRHIS